ncbi:peptide deformylase [Paracoccaceae bacterium]|jgi:peptide deformylase|nr:peptide deformylase [Paracoccaceae bacterium]RCL80699.1 MAG: peptide deformylase [Paracoccaceae bacterium]|tara:strand:+ start:14158 stop:14682 length:525 start_codon:yes stop_codon:yes gene_type:complete
MIRSIVLHPDARLKKKSVEVENITDALIKLAEDMMETMYDAPGIGLAAPQIGVLERLIVMDCAKKEDEEPDPIIMVNPTIIASSEENSVYEEGCLSIPEHFAEITRPEFVQVEWIDLGGKQHSEEFNGLKSTCVQHEIDHLNGKLFIDYLGPMKRQLITRKMQKFKREKLRGDE